jgi:Protein of unknown function (DUF4007)
MKRRATQHRQTMQPNWSSRTPSSAMSFSGHETFVFRYGWLKKAMDAAVENPSIFTSDEAMAALGVGKNMVRSIRHWALATRVLEEEPGTRGAQLKPSSLGNLILGPAGSDPYLEDVNSLWVLHWNLVNNESRATTWCWAFNHFPSGEFTRDALFSFMEGELARRNNKAPSENSLRRDVDCFVRTYLAPGRRSKSLILEESLDCPLVELNLIEEDVTPGLFRFRRGPQETVSDEVFAYTLVEFWEQRAPHRETLAFAEAAYAFGSPGCAFKMDENSLIDRLERLDTISKGRMMYTETAGLKQIYRRGPLKALGFLKSHYARSASGIQIQV